MHESFRDAVGLAERVHRAEISAREAVEAAIARIEVSDPTVNAVVHERFEAALVEADNGLPNGPLRGVPVLVKDLGAEVAGLPATAGSRLFAEYRSRQDSEIVARYRRAGLVVLGTTNTPEFGKNASTDPRCAAAVDRMAATCVDLGHDVVEAAPSYDAHAATLASSTIMVANLVEIGRAHV